jgi:hypothetical protein
LHIHTIARLLCWMNERYSLCFKIKVTFGHKLCYEIKVTFGEISLKLLQMNSVWNVAKIDVKTM